MISKLKQDLFVTMIVCIFKLLSIIYRLYRIGITDTNTNMHSHATRQAHEAFYLWVSFTFLSCVFYFISFRFVSFCFIFYCFYFVCVAYICSHRACSFIFIFFPIFPPFIYNYDSIRFSVCCRRRMVMFNQLFLVQRRN